MERKKIRREREGKTGKEERRGSRKAMTCGGRGWYNQGGFGFTLEEMKSRCVRRSSY